MQNTPSYILTYLQGRIKTLGGPMPKGHGGPPLPFSPLPSLALLSPLPFPFLPSHPLPYLSPRVPAILCRIHFP